LTAPVTYIPEFLTPLTSMAFHRQLRDELDWERREGAPRYEYWTNTFGRPYTYGRDLGRRTYEARYPHWLVDDARQRIQTQCGDFLEGCFLNRYVDGRDALGWHSDDDPSIDHTKPIAVITVGAGRAIQFKSQESGSHPVEQFLEPGSLLLMHAGMQSTHFHRIPKVGAVVGERISLTFRGLLP
jgi:alkylated DNA repair dioxygenase AlkB